MEIRAIQPSEIEAARRLLVANGWDAASLMLRSFVCSCHGRRWLWWPSWIVDDCFNTGRRVTTWMGARVIKYHRTVEDHFRALTDAGFAVESVRESRPERAHFADEETFLRRQRIPLFLFMAGRKL